ncbi:hypothetical protein JST97_20800 [bacterium]|nr:hypothetical protein [bacterium]
MAFPVHPNGGQIGTGYNNQPVRYQPQVLPQQQSNPTDGFVPTQQTQGMMPPPQQPQVASFQNGLSVQHLSQNGQMTGMYATLPGGPGGLLGSSIMLCLSTAPAQNTLGAKFTQAQAYELGADGKVLRDDQNQPKALKADIMADGRVYVQTDKDNPSAPLVMLDPDGSFGLATPAQPRVQGDPQFNMGYTREQVEFVKPDGTRGWRLNEDVGSFSQASNSSGGLTGMLTSGLGMSSGGRDVTYTEVQETPQRQLESRDIHFKQAGPGAPWPGFSQGNQWSKMLAMNAPDSRERTVHQEGPVIRLEGGWSGKRMLSLFTGKAGLGVNSWTYGKQETVTFVPLSTQKSMQPPPGQPPLPNTPPVMGGPLQSPPPLPEGF